MSKVCTSCGCVIENDNAKFCDECGAKFEIASPVKIVPAGVSGSGKLKIGGATNNFLQKNVSDNDEEPSNDKVVAESACEKEELQTSVLSEDDEDDAPLESVPFEAETEPIRPEVVDDDDEEEAAYESEEMVQENVPVIDDEDDGEDLEPPVKSNEGVSPSEKKKIFNFAQKETSPETMPQSGDMVTNDPYYDDVLPEINNEKVTLQKDIVYKVLAATVAMILVIILMLYAFS